MAEKGSFYWQVAADMDSYSLTFSFLPAAKHAGQWIINISQRERRRWRRGETLVNRDARPSRRRETFVNRRGRWWRSETFVNRDARDITQVGGGGGGGGKLLLIARRSMDHHSPPSSPPPGSKVIF